MAAQPAQRFIEHLSGLDRGARAELRRSLAFDPGQHVLAFQYVERFAPDDGWRRNAYYLTAGLYALHPEHAEGRNFGRSVADLQQRKASSSTETRFLALLDADSDQLAYRLRQMVSLVKSESISVDWRQLLDDLFWWNYPERRVQRRWARGFYSTQPDEDDQDETDDTND
jgi:CRISPR system Cascade subunit CasB